MYLLQPNGGVPALNTFGLENLSVLPCVLVASGVTLPMGVVHCVMGGWSLCSLWFSISCTVPILCCWVCYWVEFTCLTSLVPSIYLCDAVFSCYDEFW